MVDIPRRLDSCRCRLATNTEGFYPQVTRAQGVNHMDGVRRSWNHDAMGSQVGERSHATLLTTRGTTTVRAVQLYSPI